MKSLMPEDIRRAVKGRWVKTAQSVPVTGVTTDSRALRQGDLFVALRGSKFDGHEFLAVAADGGCVGALVDARGVPDEAVAGRFPAGVISVADTTLALGELGAFVRQGLAATVVGVTGSNGKTTVKRMIHHILSGRRKGTASPKSFNNNIGVPLTLFGVAEGDDYVICEIGSNAPGEIAALANIARPDIAVITSVGPTHLEKLIDVEHVAIEKAAILSGLTDGGVGVIWADSEPLAKAVRAYPDVRLIRFGQSDSADLRLTGYEPTPSGGRFQLNGRAWFNLSVPGRHNASNALAAVAVAQRLGVGQDEAALALATYSAGAMRLQQVELGSITLINDAYNANPASVRAGGDALASFAGRRRVMIVGDMLELGPDSVRLHEETGQALAATGVAMIVGVGALGRAIAAGARAAGHRATVEIASVEQAMGQVSGLLASGDVVLLKGSRGMAMERLVEPIQAAFAGECASGSKGLTPC